MYFLFCIRDQLGNLVKELVPFCMKCARQRRKLEGNVKQCMYIIDLCLKLKLIILSHHTSKHTRPSHSQSNTLFHVTALATFQIFYPILFLFWTVLVQVVYSHCSTTNVTQRSGIQAGLFSLLDNVHLPILNIIRTILYSL